MWRVFKRDIGSQFRVSKNLKERLPMKIKRAFYAFVLIFKALFLAVKAMRREQLGSRVVYRGKPCYVSNWSGSDRPTLAADDWYERGCDRSEIRNVHNLKEFYHRFLFGFEFYMGYWYGIDVNKRLYPAAFRAEATND